MLDVTWDEQSYNCIQEDNHHRKDQNEGVQYINITAWGPHFTQQLPLTGFRGFIIIPFYAILKKTLLLWAYTLIVPVI